MVHSVIIKVPVKQEVSVSQLLRLQLQCSQRTAFCFGADITSTCSYSLKLGDTLSTPSRPTALLPASGSMLQYQANSALQSLYDMNSKLTSVLCGNSKRDMKKT